MTHAATIRFGNLELADRAEFRRGLRRLGDGKVIVTVEKPKRPRSTQANRYYFGCVVRVIAEEIGIADPEEMHEILAFKFLRLEDDPVTGSPRRRRTRTMTSAEFSKYVRDVVTWAEADMGWRIPRPEEWRDEDSHPEGTDADS